MNRPDASIPKAEVQIADFIHLREVMHAGCIIAPYLQPIEYIQ